MTKLFTSNEQHIKMIDEKTKFEGNKMTKHSNDIEKQK